MAPGLRGGGAPEYSTLSPNTNIPDEADHSVLQQPLNLGVKNVKQILKCIQSGSPEIRDLILNECNIIYECKVCLSLFRSLANFLYHKRGFCQKHLCESMLLFEAFDETETTEVFPKTSEETKKECEKSSISVSLTENEVMDTAVPAEKSSEVSIAEEKTIIDVPSKMTVDPSASSLDDEKSASEQETDISVQNEKVAEISKSENTAQSIVENDEKVQQKVPIILRPILGNHNAVFQDTEKQTSSDAINSVVEVEGTKENEVSDCHTQGEFTEENEDVIVCMPVEEKVEDIQTCAKGNNQSISPPKDIHLSRRKRLLNRSDCSVQMLKCFNCSTQFTTLKTLYFHMMSFHSQSRMYYPCPYCKTLFVQMYGVTRHLIQVHGKTKEQINNKMRESIRKRAVWKRLNENSERKEGKRAAANDIKPQVKDIDVITQDTRINLNKIEKGVSIPDIKSENKIFHSYVKMEKNLSLHHCTKCDRVFSRKSSQVSHEKFCIMNSSKADQPEIITISPSSSPPLSKVSVELQKRTFESKINTRPKRGAEKRMHKDFVNSQTLKWRSANKIQTANRTAQQNLNAKNAKFHERRVMSIVNVVKLLCLKCNRKFSSISNLRRHAAIHIGWTRYKCKHCNLYQSYNKSDCRHHIERMHAVAEEEIDKFIIHLISEMSSDKTLNNTSPKSIKSKSFKSESKKDLPRLKKRDSARNSSVHKKPVSPLRSKIPQNDVKNNCHEKKQSPDSKKDKCTKTDSKQPASPVKKLPSNYKSVTTSSPTTIILSKTCSSSSVQIMRNNAPVHVHDSLSSNKKSITTRISLRKVEPDEKSPNATSNSSVISLGTRSKTNIMQIIPCKVTNPSHCEENKATIALLNNSDKTCAKKNRPISDWFPKKPPANIVNAALSASSSVPRRDSAPVIIGLVPASNSAALRSKTSTS